MSYDNMDAELRERIHDWTEIPGKITLFETIEEFIASVWDAGVIAAHNRLREYVQDDGMIDQHTLIKFPTNPYRRVD